MTMITLSQFVTQDSIAAIYSPLIKARPVLVLYFLALLFIVSIALMNLVTAVLVEGALEHARQEKEPHGTASGAQKAFTRDLGRGVCPKFLAWTRRTEVGGFPVDSYITHNIIDHTGHIKSRLPLRWPREEVLTSNDAIKAMPLGV